MHLVTVAINTPGWCVEVSRLRRALKDSAADSDRLQHAYLEAQQGIATLSLYLRAMDAEDATRLAEQLCRRTMAAVCTDQTWSLSFTRLLS